MCSHYDVIGIWMDGEELLNLGLLVYHPKRISDWERGSRQGERDVGRQGRSVLL